MKLFAFAIEEKLIQSSQHNFRPLDEFGCSIYIIFMQQKQKTLLPVKKKHLNK